MFAQQVDSVFSVVGITSFLAGFFLVRCAESIDRRSDPNLREISLGLGCLCSDCTRTIVNVNDSRIYPCEEAALC